MMAEKSDNLLELNNNLNIILSFTSVSLDLENPIVQTEIYWDMVCIQGSLIVILCILADF